MPNIRQINRGMKIRKIVGISLTLCAIVVAVICGIVISTIIKSTPSDVNYFQTIAIVAAIGGFTIFALLGLGGLLVSRDKETDIIVENPNNPLICHDCKREYDRTWKVCIKCGKPLVEKQR